MKQITTFILTLFAFCSISAQTNNFYLTKNAIGKTFFANEIDSITYNDIGDTFVEQIWSKGIAYETALTQNDTLSIKGTDDIECVFIKNNSVLGGFIANTGDFLILLPSSSSSGDLHLAIGNVYNNEDKIVCDVDSFGIIRHIYAEKELYSIIYTEDSLTILGNKNGFKKSYAYDIFSLEKDNTKLPLMRAGGISASWQYKTISVLKTFVDIIKGEDDVVTLKGVAARLGMYLGTKYLDNLEGKEWHQLILDLLTLDCIDPLLLLIEQLDAYIDRQTFGNMSIETLDAQNLGRNSYSIGCKINYSTTDYLYSDYPHSYRITMDIKGGGRHWRETKADVSSDNNVTFPLSGLDYNTKYTYKPRLDFVVYNPKLQEYVTIAQFLKECGITGYDLKNLPPYTNRYLEGEEKSFTTEEPTCTTGLCENVTDKSAMVKCSYHNIPEDAECGVLLSWNDGQITIPASSSEGEQTINITGLKANTIYNYNAYIKYNDECYNGNVESFTTNPPDISGTWTCVETYYINSNYSNPQYRTYTIVLNKNGKGEVNNGEDYSKWDAFDGWSWELHGNKLQMECILIANQSQYSGYKINGTVDNLDDPKKITGRRFNWNFNQYGSYESDGWEIVMTR